LIFTLLCKIAIPILQEPDDDAGAEAAQAEAA
jgi:hypothetical protein